MMKYLKLFKEYNSYKKDPNFVLYHGSYKEHDFSKSGEDFDYNGTFFSTRIDDANTYGDIIYEVKLKSGLNIFDSSDMDDCKKLMKKFKVLYDLNFKEGEKGFYIKSAKMLCGYEENWMVLECTTGVIEWLRENYDGVIMFEGGTENYLIFEPVNEKIESYKIDD